ncbi:MAG TPA: hypothetical protein VFL93_06640 [Longimicrobiaceae bacterium]|nr:hypothetical protein [Longimicrobiaceae bacterium]
MADHDHHHDHDHDEDATYGMALGFRTIEEAGKLYLVEAEIAPYVDEPDELGATLVFHPLDEIDPSDTSEEAEWPSWPIDIDDDLTRDPDAPLKAQFQAILRQLHGLSADQLREYMGVAREG